MKRFFKAILAIFGLLLLTVAAAGAQEVQGKVTNAKTGKPMIGVNILLIGTTTGTATNTKGHYELVVPSLEDSLRFTFIGFQTKKVAINGRTTIDVK